MKSQGPKQQKMMAQMTALLFGIIALSVSGNQSGPTRVLKLKENSPFANLPLAKGVRIRELSEEKTSNDPRQAQSSCFRDNKQTSSYHVAPRDGHESNSTPNNQTCTVPQVPIQLFLQRPLCRKMPCSRRESCLLVAENILAHFGHGFDMILFASEICQDKFRPGNLTVDMIEKMLPRDELLVGLRLNSTDLIEALEQGLNDDDEEDTAAQRPVHANKVDRFPIVAGVKFGVKEVMLENGNDQKSKQTQVINVHSLSHQCSWESIDPHATYSILTTESLAFGKWGYSALTKSYGYWNTGRTLRSVLWDQVTSTCQLQQPIPHNLPGTNTATPTTSTLLMNPNSPSSPMATNMGNQYVKKETSNGAGSKKVTVGETIVYLSGTDLNSTSRASSSSMIQTSSS